MLSRIIFLQKRIGYQNQPFYIIKLKTMRDLRDEEGNLLPDKQRVTIIGRFLRKTSLDELPQLINILKGDMCLVGPRPLLPEYLPLYTPQQLKRHSVKPGITGWAQVNGRNSLTWQQKFELDLWYVENRSFRLDLKILWLTFLNIFRKRDGDELAEKFNGKN
ncbi:sugar transferase [uncultured Microscilla sp.]|uniref:sugar transferase n=1 Tax=uncultured Microscilla sp. TaxID=432653 RepID=UPI0026179A4F|nr:sugar transferase [uncultured Microscilla sp.]